jgi:uncharacterized Ntn-hydrolase superfamily protein
LTYSIAARTPDAGHFGMAIASSSPAVAARCAHARAGVGVVATQNITDPALGPRILDLLARTRLAEVQGSPAAAALGEALRTTPYGAFRQLIVVGSAGAVAIHSGDHALGLVGTASGAHAAAAGNLLADPTVPAAMIEAFEAATGPFGDRLLQALRAGQSRGGEAGPVHSAGLLVVRDLSWPIVDLRVDWDDHDPVRALGALWDRYAPQIEDYVRRAVDPGAAPAFAVPGNP